MMTSKKRFATGLWSTLTALALVLPLLLSYGNVFDVSANAQTITDVEPCYMPSVGINVDYVVLTPGASTSVSAKCIPTSNTVEWSSDDSSIATVSGTGTTAIVRAKASGVVMINAYSGSLVDSIPVYVSDTNLSGLKYLYNAENSCVASIKLPVSDSVTLVQQWANVQKTQQQWLFQYIGNGLYAIQSLRSERYLGIESTSNNSKIRQYSDYTSNNTKWVIAKTTNNNYRLTPVSCLSSGYSLSTQNSKTTNGLSLLLKEFDGTSNKCCEWHFTTVDYTWNDNQDSVGVWQKNPQVYVECETGDSASRALFASYVSYAISTWSSALNIPITETTNSSVADIKVYYGSWDYLVEKGCSYSTLEDQANKLGATRQTIATNTNITISAEGETKLVEIMRGAEIYITTNPFKASDENGSVVYTDIVNNTMQQTVIHEFGHALGYNGHSTQKADIMYASASASTRNTLSLREIYHLRLVYDKHH